ncbi:hypothetical protein TNCV_2215731 [Trichonephila clavipes]|nr:hypothetical protein TNCV_2215731 [Trichonephila clavipes]
MVMRRTTCSFEPFRLIEQENSRSNSTRNLLLAVLNWFLFLPRLEEFTGIWGGSLPRRWSGFPRDRFVVLSPSRVFSVLLWAFLGIPSPLVGVVWKLGNGGEEKLRNRYRNIRNRLRHLRNRKQKFKAQVQEFKEQIKRTIHLKVQKFPSPYGKEPHNFEARVRQMNWLFTLQSIHASMRNLLDSTASSELELTTRQKNKKDDPEFATLIIPLMQRIFNS